MEYAVVVLVVLVLGGLIYRAKKAPKSTGTGPSVKEPKNPNNSNLD